MVVSDTLVLKLLKSPKTELNHGNFSFAGSVAAFWPLWFNIADNGKSDTITVLRTSFLCVFVAHKLFNKAKPRKYTF